MILNRKFSSFFKKIVQNNNIKKDKQSPTNSIQNSPLHQSSNHNHINNNNNNNTSTTIITYNNGSNVLTISNNSVNNSHNNNNSNSINNNNNLEIEDNYQQNQLQQQKIEQNNNSNNNDNENNNNNIEDIEDEIKPTFSFIKKSKPTLEDGITFNNKIQQRFSKDSNTFVNYINILKRYTNEKVHLIEVYYQICELFKDHQDLIEDYVRFLPDEIEEMINHEKQNQHLHLKQ